MLFQFNLKNTLFIPGGHFKRSLKVALKAAHVVDLRDAAVQHR